MDESSTPRNVPYGGTSARCSRWRVVRGPFSLALGTDDLTAAVGAVAPQVAVDRDYTRLSRDAVILDFSEVSPSD